MVMLRVLNRPPSNFTGEYAFGWLRTETGVHRLVRKAHSIQAVVVILHSVLLSFIRKLMKMLRSRSIRPICVSTFTAPLVRVVSTLTELNLRCVLPTSRLIL